MMPRKGVYLVWYHYESIHDLQRLVQQGSRVLDLGCGEGLFTKKIPNYYHVCGLYISRKCLEQAKAKDPTKSWVLTSAFYLPFREGSFNAVVCHQVIEHVKDREKVICEIFRILKPGGVLIITTPIKGPWGYFLILHRNPQGKAVLSPDHLSEYKSMKEFILSLTECTNNQLRVIKKMKRSVQVPLTRLLRYFFTSKVKHKMFPAILYYYDIYVVCRKYCKISASKTSSYQIMN